MSRIPGDRVLSELIDFSRLQRDQAEENRRQRIFELGLQDTLTPTGLPELQDEREPSAFTLGPSRGRRTAELPKELQEVANFTWKKIVEARAEGKLSDDAFQQVSQQFVQDFGTRTLPNPIDLYDAENEVDNPQIKLAKKRESIRKAPWYFEGLEDTIDIDPDTGKIDYTAYSEAVKYHTGQQKAEQEHRNKLFESQMRAIDERESAFDSVFKSTEAIDEEKYIRQKNAFAADRGRLREQFFGLSKPVGATPEVAPELQEVSAAIKAARDKAQLLKIPAISNQSEYDSLKSGVEFIDVSDGLRYKKP